MKFKQAITNRPVNNFLSAEFRSPSPTVTFLPVKLVEEEGTPELQASRALWKAGPELSNPSDCPNKMQQQWKQNSLNLNRHDFILIGLTLVSCTLKPSICGLGH